MTLPLNSYIAHVPTVRPYHLAAKQDLTDRSIPCVISNELQSPDYPQEYPLCPLEKARESVTNRIITLKELPLAFFILFLDDSQRDEIAAFELGLAIQRADNIILLGSRPRNNPQCIWDGCKKIHSYYDYENFIAARFP